MRRLVTLVFSFLCAGTACADSLDTDVARVMQTFDVPGVAIAIVKDGHVTTRGFGVRKLGEAAPVDEQTLFQIASNTKAFTAVALAMLVDQGKLAWDDAVTKHLPDFQLYDAYATHEMTIRDLLTHRSGLGVDVGDLLWWPTTTFSTDDIIARLRYIKPATSFRSKYAYDNLLYIVAGKIIAAKSGKSWGETIHASILTPIGMTATTTSLAESAANANQSGAHSKVDERTTLVKPMAVENAAGAVGINTNAVDIAKWMQVLLDQGRLGSTRLYSAAQARELWTVQTPRRIGVAPAALAATQRNFAGFGLGFLLEDYHGVPIALHGGWMQGFYTQVILVPQAHLGIAIFTNAESEGALTALQYRLLDQYMGIAPTDWITIVGERERAAHAEEVQRLHTLATSLPAASTPSLALAAYDGEYEDAWYGKVTIRHEGNKQIVRFARTPDLTGELTHWQHDTFIVRWQARNFNADAYVTFALKPDGSIERVRMAAISGETDGSYDFSDLDLRPVAHAL